MTSVVAGLATTAVKGTRLRAVDQLELDAGGARGNRRFYVIDERDRMVNGKHVGELQGVIADFAPETGVLELRFPGGHVVSGAPELGPSVTTRFFSGLREDRLALGPWAPALSEFLGQPVRLVASASAVDRGQRGAVSLISRASLARLAEVGGAPDLDARRFRMLIEADGIPAHAEDAWVGGRVRIGEAVVRWHGHVGRCLITSRDPETGVVDLPTLDILGSYRRDEAATEPLPFGIYGEVLTGGRVRVGDAIAPEG
jgi:uncharacterized protein YcbX